MSLPLFCLGHEEVHSPMRHDRFSGPLTEEEQQFAIEHHDVIAKYLRKRRLPMDEWYDIVIFRYCRSVKRWFGLPELRKYNFEIIAFYAMRSAIGHEFEKRRRRIKTVSLDAEIPHTHHLTYRDLIANKEHAD